MLELREPSYDETEAIEAFRSLFPVTAGPAGQFGCLKYIPVLAGIPRASAAQLAKSIVFKSLYKLILNFFTRSETEEDPQAGLQHRMYFWRINPRIPGGRRYPIFWSWSRRLSVSMRK